MRREGASRRKRGREEKLKEKKKTNEKEEADARREEGKGKMAKGRAAKAGPDFPFFGGRWPDPIFDKKKRGGIRISI